MPESHIESSAQYLQEQQRAVQEEAAMQSDTNDTEVVPVYIELPLFVERHEDHYSGDDITRQYLGEIGDADLLTAEDEKILARAIVQGRIASAQLAEGAANRDLLRIVANAAEARRRFMVANTRLVVSIAKRYLGRGMQFLDLIQEGNLGLIKAVDKFDISKGYAFSTYAIWWSSASVRRYLQEHGGNIKIPTYVTERISKIDKVIKSIEAEGEIATPEEVSIILDLPIEDVKHAMKSKNISSVLSLDYSSDESDPLSNIIADETQKRIASRQGDAMRFA